jgi:hypothetical protein
MALLPLILLILSHTSIHHNYLIMSCLTILLFASLLLFNQPVLGQCPQDSFACGYYGQLCCTPGQTCTTNGNNEAECVSGPGSSPPLPSSTCSAFCGFWGQVAETVIWSTVRMYSTFMETGCLTTPSTTTVTVISTSISTITLTSPCIQTSTQPPPSIPASTSAQLPVCPSRWYMCDTNQGGGCCPVGHECGTNNQCTVATTSSSTMRGNLTTSCTTTTTLITCNYSLNESACGSICCSSGQYCSAPGICVVVGAAPLRPTGSTTTVPLEPRDLT